MARLRSVMTWKTGLLAIVLVSVGWYFWKPASAPPRYVLAAVTRGTLIVSVSGSGQVAGSQQVDLKPEKSAMITTIFVSSSQMVKTGDPIAQLDSREAQKTVRDAGRGVASAQISLASARISLQKLTQPSDAPTLLNAQNASDQAERDYHKLIAGPDPTDVTKAEQDLAIQKEAIRLSSDGKNSVTIRNAYDTAVPSIQSAVQTMQQVLVDVGGVLGVDRGFVNEGLRSTISALDTTAFTDAKNLYAEAEHLILVSRTRADALTQNNEDTATIDAAIASTMVDLQKFVTLARRTSDVLAATLPNTSLSASSLQSLQSSMQSDASSVSTKQSALLTVQQGLDKIRSDARTAVATVTNAELVLAKLKAGATADELTTAREKMEAANAALKKVQQGADTLDIQTSKNDVADHDISLSSALNALSDAQAELAKYTLRAPFDGQVAKISLHKNDPASPSTAIATLVTTQKVAQITVNEVDAAKVHVGQKVTLTFDAIPDLTMAGSVYDADTAGTVTQGVVSYAVKIIFSTDDDRVKPGMSVSASIATDIRPDVLLIPNAAIIRNGNTTAVRFVDAHTSITQPSGTEQGVLLSTAPQLKSVTVGVANDSQTEISEGLAESDQIVIRVIEATAAKATTQQTSILNTVRGGGGGGGGNFRAATGR